MNNSSAKKILQLINSKPLSKFCITFAKYTCECGLHNVKVKNNEEILKCKGCNNLMGYDCIKYDKSICLICVGKNIDINSCRMCANCGDIISYLKKCYCGICKERIIKCVHNWWVLCKKCKDLPFAIKN